jgi:hypothetical protein
VTDVKGLLQSKTVWASILAIVFAVAGLLGHTFSPADQQMVVDLVTTIGTSVSGLWAILSRKNATSRIG